jgi:signal peptidase I
VKSRFRLYHRSSSEEKLAASRARFGLFQSRSVRRLVLLLALAVAIRRWAWMPAFIVGDSMLPALHAGQIVAVNKLIYIFEAPRRGDVVEIWTDKELMTKRVIGLPNEEMAVRDGAFYIDGRPLAEPYVQFKDHNTITSGRIGLNQFVVAGDNRPRSLIAVVNRNRIIGRVRHTE